MEITVSIFAFCLLPQDIHLIIQSQLAQNLSIFIKTICQDYSVYFESRYQIQENVFSGRQKSLAIIDDIALTEYIKFVEFMPVKYQLADTPAQFPWSSYNYRVLGDGDGVLDKIPRDGAALGDRQVKISDWEIE